MTSPTPTAQQPDSLQHGIYTGSVEPDDAGWHGRVLHITDVVTYSADTLHGLAQQFHHAVEDYIQTCAECGDEPSVPVPPTTGAAP